MLKQAIQRFTEAERCHVEEARPACNPRKLERVQLGKEAHQVYRCGRADQRRTLEILSAAASARRPAAKIRTSTVVMLFPFKLRGALSPLM
jgi:hypothetical protein